MNVNLAIQKVSNLESIPADEQFEKWVRVAVSNRDQDTEISLRIVDEEEARELNHNWRNKDYATNVLSFPVGEPVPQAPELLGDIVICAPVVSREAEEQGKSIEAHWAHLVIHGVLHLQGYDHEQEDDARKMEALEITLLDKIGYANPYETELES